MTPREQPDSQAGDEQIRYLVWNLVDHYQNDHPDPDQTEECRFAIETIEELEAYAERLATERAIAELKQLPSERHESDEICNGSFYIDSEDRHNRIAALSATLTGEAKQ